MSARAVAGSRPPLSRSPARIRVQRNHFRLRLARHVVTFSPPGQTRFSSSPTLGHCNRAILQRAYPPRVDDRRQTTTTYVIVESLRRRPPRVVAEVLAHSRGVHDPAITEVVQLL